MKLLTTVLVFLCALPLLASAAPAPANDVQLRIYFSDRSQLIPLYDLGVDIVWTDDGFIEVITNPSEADRIAKLGFQIETVRESVSQFYQSRLDQKDMGGYKTLDEMYAYLDGIIADHHEIVSAKESIGLTYEGRDIWAVKISDNPGVDEDEPEILLTAGIHCREVATPEVLFHAMDYLTENYAGDPEVQALVDEREIWFIVACNPDGYRYNEVIAPGGGGMWRKNRRDNGDGSFGIDLNRNFGYQWGYDNQGSSPIPSSDLYRGIGPFSEPETQALRDFTLAHDFAITCYYHSYGNIFIYPWGYIPEETVDQDIYGAMGDSIQAMNGYLHGPVSTLLYAVNGGNFDWEYGDYSKPKIFGSSIEVGGYGDGFWPTLARLEVIKAENLEPMLFLIRMAGRLYQVKEPQAPIMAALPTSVDGAEYTVSWSHDDPYNPAEEYRLVELQNRKTIANPAENFEGWSNEYYSVSTARYASPPSSYYTDVVYGSPIQLTTPYPYAVPLFGRLTFDVYYDLIAQIDYFYVEISTDGLTFTSIPGNITSDFNPYGRNQGNGISGTVGYWEQAEFDLSDYYGQSVYFRFHYVLVSSHPGEGVYIDNIYPHLSFESSTVISSSLTEPSITLTDKPRGVYYYWVQAKDAENQWSPYSNIVGTDVLGPGVGDPDLDGIVGSIADLTQLNLYRGYGIGAYDVYPEIQPGEADFDCNGIPGTAADAVALQQIVLGAQTPCYAADPEAAKVSQTSAATSGPAAVAEPGDYAVRLNGIDFAKTDSAWVDIDLTSANDAIVGFQFQLDYDFTLVQLTAVEPGDALGNWQYMDYAATDDGTTGRLSIAAQAWDQGDPILLEDIAPSVLPATLVRLHFSYVNPSGQYETPIRFAWSDCGDNGLVLGGLLDGAVVLDSLALSNRVLDPSGDPLDNEQPSEYLGASDGCLDGLFGDGPARMVDFQNGVLVHDGSCCVSPVGDANNDGKSEPTIGDITIMIDALFVSENPNLIGCLAEADVNQSGPAEPTFADISIGDVSYLIDYLFITGETLGLFDCR